MKKIATLLFLLIAFNGMSQSTVGYANRWKIGFQLVKDFNTAPDQIGQNAGYINMKPGDLNYSVGITALLSISQKFQITTGAFYSNKDMNGTLFCHICDLISNVPVELRQRYAEVPVSLRYLLIDKKIKLFTETGFSGSYLVSNKDENRNNWNLATLNKFLFGAHLGVGGGINISSRFNINLTAAYKRSLSNFSDESDFKLSSFSTGIGVVYNVSAIKY